jgi:hypothetical protein
MLFRIVILYRREPLRKKKKKKFNTHLSFDYKIPILLKKNLKKILTYKKKITMQPK